jgi:hypothetical protein
VATFYLILQLVGRVGGRHHPFDFTTSWRDWWFFNICHVHLEILLEISIILHFSDKNKTGHCTSSFTESGVMCPTSSKGETLPKLWSLKSHLLT